MAYVTGNFNLLISPGLLESNNNLWSYLSSDSLTTMRAAGYVSDAGNKGVRAGDLVIAVNAASGQSYVMQVASITSGAATLSLQDAGVQLLGAAGTTQAGATLIAANGMRNKVIVVQTSLSTHGLVLPVAQTGMEFEIFQRATSLNVKIYPATGATINGGGANAAVALTNAKAGIFLAKNATSWYLARTS